MSLESHYTYKIKIEYPLVTIDYGEIESPLFTYDFIGRKDFEIVKMIKTTTQYAKDNFLEKVYPHGSLGRYYPENEYNSLYYLITLRNVSTGIYEYMVYSENVDKNFKLIYNSITDSEVKTMEEVYLYDGVLLNKN